MLDPELRHRLEERIDYRFADGDHLRDAMTHRSFVNEHPAIAPTNNERLEFLGDAILDVAASELLFAHYPEADEGELSRRRADLVCERALADLARELDVGPCLRLGKGEEGTGGRDKPRLLASAVEALIAAVSLDGGLEKALKVSKTLLAPHLDREEPGSSDYKSRLQELLQAEGRPAPVYRLVASSGPDHDRRFVVAVDVEKRELAQGKGNSKLAAEQSASRRALRMLKDQKAL